MKITENYLRSIIRKELRSVLNEIEADKILPRINISPTLNLDIGLSNLIKQRLNKNYNPTKEELEEIKQDIAQNVYYPTIFDLDKVDFKQQNDPQVRIKLIDEITGIVWQLGTPEDTGIVKILVASPNLEETVKLIKNQLSKKAKELMGPRTIEAKATEISPTPPAPSKQIDKQQVAETIEKLKNLTIPDIFDEDSVDNLKNKIRDIPTAINFEGQNRRTIISLQLTLLDSIQVDASNQTVQQNLNNLISKLEEFIR